MTDDERPNYTHIERVDFDKLRAITQAIGKLCGQLSDGGLSPDDIILGVALANEINLSCCESHEEARFRAKAFNLIAEILEFGNGNLEQYRQYIERNLDKPERKGPGDPSMN